MKILLRMKHWQLFILLLAPSFILNIFLFSAQQDFSTTALQFSIGMVLTTAVFFGWFYSMGTMLHRKLPDTVRMNITRFKIFLFIPLIYILFLSFFFGPISINDDLSGAVMTGLIIPVHLFSMFCIFYCLYFNAKALKAVEWQKNVTFSDFAGEFFLIWFFPIGLWIIQPRINKLVENNK